MQVFCILCFLLSNIIHPVRSRLFALPNLTSHPPKSNDSCDARNSLHGDNLEQRVIDLFDEAESLPLSLSKEKGNIEVRTKFVGQIMTTLATVKVVKQHPSAFKAFLENFNEAFTATNPMMQEMQLLEHEEKREGIKAFLIFPFPLAKRIMVHWKYVRTNRKEDEHLLILSEEGNKDLVRKYLTTQEREKYVLARTFLCAYWVKPLRDGDQQIVGSSIQYVFSGDVGGSVPQWIQRTIGPKTALDSVKGIIGYAQ